MKHSLTFDTLMPMSLLGLGVLTAASGIQTLNEIPKMRVALTQAYMPIQTPVRLKPMVEPIEFINGVAVVRK